MTKEERADAYVTHGEFIQLELLKTHFHWSGHRMTTQERKDKIKELEANLAAKQFRFQNDKAWHGMDFESAVKAAIKTRSKALKRDDLNDLKEMIPLMKDYMNVGIHGGSFLSRFFHQVDEAGMTIVMDDRTPKPPHETELPMLLASYSLEMLAHEFGEMPLIRAMVDSARTETHCHSCRMMGHFPTALVGLEA